VPEIGLTPQLVARVEAAVDEPVVVLHSALSEADRRDGLQLLREGRARVVVGARSAVFAPVKNLGLVIVDEEHDPSLKQEEHAPRYHARDVALWRAAHAGAGCVLGNACEFKNCLLLDGVEVPHFSYVGDSVLGNQAHLGAGVVLSNLRLDRKEISVHAEGRVYATGLRKFGAILGDAAEVGCNAVLNPGTLLGRRALVMPTVAFSGYLAANTVARVRASVSRLPRRD
jgi:acetyltransferase-like isoleucine patch superfamily enzyme